jgi:hypothetical protein
MTKKGISVGSIIVAKNEEMLHYIKCITALPPLPPRQPSR